MSTPTSNYEQAEAIVREDGARYAAALALGWGKAIVRALAIAAVGTPILFFWLIVFASDGSAMMIAVTPADRQTLLVAFTVIAGVAFILGSKPDALVRGEVERLRDMLMAKDMAIDAIEDRSGVPISQWR